MDRSKSSDDSLVDGLMADQHDRRLPALIRREVRLPAVEGTANTLIGMRRSGKTYCLLGATHDLMAGEVPHSRILYLNLEDDRLGTADLGTRDRVLEVFHRRDLAARVERANGSKPTEQLLVVPRT